MKKSVAIVCLFLVISGLLTFAQSPAPTVLPLWEKNATQSYKTEDKNTPTLTLFAASGDNATDCAVVICPGGGYGHLATEKEGKEIAEWFNGVGVTAFVLKYRLPSDGYRHPIPLMDARQAIRLVRYRAEEWGIDPDKIGIVGFSAGGHLAASAGTHFKDPVEAGSNELDTVSCRPDFMVLIYPVISMENDITHHGSRDNLLGKHPEAALVDLMSNEKQVTSGTPPTFLVHATDDKTVPVENSLLFYRACLDNNVPAELHIYLKGGHGFGMRTAAGPAAEWPGRCKQWMQQLGFLPK